MQTKIKKIRKLFASKLLVEKGFCSSLTEAAALIYAGKVLADEQRITKPGERISEQAILRIKTKGKYVSRGGDKLFNAIVELGLSELFADTLVLDIGASKGGFTDCVLQLGAREVLALDVGTNQLDWRLRTDARVTCIEQTDIRTFNTRSDLPLDWILADISFNSLERLAPTLMKLASPQSRLLILVKPQFELPKSDIPDGGVVLAEELWEKAITRVSQSFLKLGAGNLLVARSALKGRRGNQEFFLYFTVSESGAGRPSGS